jgi:hypothetical protein
VVADLQVIQVRVVMDENGGDGLGLGFPVLIALKRTITNPA